MTNKAHDHRWALQGLAQLLIMLGLIGCATPAAYRDPIIKYQLASTVVIENARLEYAEANDRKRAAFVDRAVQRRERLDLAALQSKDLQVLGSKDFETRMIALNTLAKHGELLLALASSDAPERSRASAISLGEAVANLRESLSDTPSDAFREKATGFAAIAGEIVSLVMERKITEALDRSVLASEQDAQALIGLIRGDMSALYQRRRSILSDERVAAVDDYNAVLKQAVPDRRELRETADAVLRTEERWDQLSLLQGVDPSLDAMNQAHAGLVAYAKSSKQPQDFALLVETIEAFVARVSIIADGIKRIRDS